MSNQMKQSTEWIKIPNSPQKNIDTFQPFCKFGDSLTGGKHSLEQTYLIDKKTGEYKLKLIKTR